MKNKFFKNFSIVNYFWFLVASFFVCITIIYVVLIWSYSANNSISTLKTQSSRIEKSFSESINYVAYQMNYFNSRILEKGARDTKFIRNLITSSNIIPWNIISWIDRDMKLIVSSDDGFVNPIDMSDREYIKTSFKSPNTMVFGDLRNGVLSKVLIIPISVSVADKNNKVVGAMVFGFYVDRLLYRLNNLIDYKGISFALFDNDFEPILVSENFINDEKIKDNFTKIDVSKNHSGKLTDFEFFSPKGVLRHYQKVDKYPYYVVTQYDREVFVSDFLSKLMPYLVQLLFILTILLIIIILFKRLIINPALKP